MNSNSVWPRHLFISTVLLATLSLTGCPKSVIPDYELARDTALKRVQPPEGAWEPDAVLHVSPRMLGGIVTMTLEKHANLKDTLSVNSTKVTPDLGIQKLLLSSSESCESCLAVDATLDGTVGWALGRKRGRVPITVYMGFDAEFFAKRSKDGHMDVFVQPRRVREVELKLAKGESMVTGFIEGSLGGWTEEQLLKQVPPVRLVRFDDKELPVNAVKVLPSVRGLTIGILTSSSTSQPLPERDIEVNEGWQFAISQQSLLGIVRKRAFEAGPIAHDVVVEPKDLSIGDESFTMDLRMWRVKGKGWWRDYTVDGSYERSKRGFELTPKGIEQQGQSDGAAVVDPIAVLAQSAIINALENAVDTSLPSGTTHQTKGFVLDVEVTEIRGEGDVLAMQGDVTLEDPKRPETPTGETRTWKPGTRQPRPQ